MGLSYEEAICSIRISLGKNNSKEEIDDFLLELLKYSSSSNHA
jgi:cysteine sulfinate desulfinase/cysteine desulfurase-like protein